MQFTQAFNKSLTGHTEAFWNKVIRCDWVYEEYVLEFDFIEGLPESIRHGMRSCCGFKNIVEVQDRLPHNTLLTR